MKRILHKIISSISALLPDESIKSSKQKWNSLALDNHKYYIVSKKGQNITDEQFYETGEENYRNLILEDPILKDKLGSFSDKRVLDIGCGAGRLTEFFAKDFKRADGVDISEKMVEEAKKRLSHISNVHFVAGDGMHYPFKDDEFDLVFSYIVFQHMPSVEVVKENFREIKRVLKKDGIAKIQIRGGEKVKKGTWFYGPNFTASEAKELLEDIGLSVVKMGDDSIKRFFLWLQK